MKCTKCGGDAFFKLYLRKTAKLTVQYRCWKHNEDKDAIETKEL